MFSKVSRYRKLPDEVTIDAKGRSLQSKTARLLPEVSGTFLHVVEEPDRLDHLSYKFYKQPRKWWRMIDANPKYMSPQALLGKEPVVTDRFPLAFDDGTGQPPWCGTLAALSTQLGIDDVQVVDEEVGLVEMEKEIEGVLVTVLVPQYVRAIIITHNEMNVSAEELADLLNASGFDVGQPERIARVGKKIFIPPDSTA